MTLPTTSRSRTQEIDAAVLVRNQDPAVYQTLTVQIAPETAQLWLERNDTNRPMRKSAVAQYASELRCGLWKRSGQTIKFSRTGRLLDGQHRLAAIVSSGVTADWDVTFGIADSAFDVIDTGRVRTGTDVLVIEGVSPREARIAASALPMILNHEMGRAPHSTHRYTNQLMLNYWLDQPQLAKSTRFVATLPRQLVPITYAKALFLHWVLWRKDPAVATQFLTQLFTGESLSRTSPVFQLRLKFLDDRMEGRAFDAGTQLHACIKAWNALRSGKSLKSHRSLFPQPNEPFPEIL
ncbi:hypothetical protein [Lysobacter sp. Hz 25]|uniref:hypothetical protein n=1 Tax=Lysobacter sp. Hz 25 TaxID=3383698 RepID=UPI0038D4E1D1